MPIIETLGDNLRHYRENAEKVKDEDLIFCNSAGNPVDRRNLVNRAFARALKGAGLSGVRFHDLRHTFAALSIEAGVDVKTLQVMMGHSSIRVTLDIYGHLYSTAYDRASRSLENLISGGLKVIDLTTITA